MSKNQVNAFFLLALSAASVQADEGAEHSLLPGIVHFEGIGSVAVVGLKSEKVGAGDLNTVTAVALGDVEGAVFNVSEIPFLKGKLSLSSVFINDISIDTQYGRGLNTGTEYEQELSGFGQFASLKTQLNNQQYWYANVGASLVSLGDYATAGGEVIKINDEGLHDVFSTLASVGVATGERKASADNSGLLASAELAALLFRPGQSDQGQLNYSASYTWAFEGHHAVTTYARGSHGFVLAKRSEYDEVDEVLTEINGQCDSLVSTEDKQNCEGLEQDLANYIVDSNNKGNAQPLGGAYGLRSYSEQYIKASNTLLEGLEATYFLPWSAGKGNSIELIGFAESAQANDNVGSLLDDSFYSVGVGARVNLKDTPIRLETAYGSQNTQAWFLTAGKRW
ncbi:MAG: hypothetical protein V7785_05255 [Bermanella sp.]